MLSNDFCLLPSRVCGNPHGLIRKYGLMCCRQCFHSNAKAIGFIKVLTSISITLSSASRPGGPDFVLFVPPVIFPDARRPSVFMSFIGKLCIRASCNPPSITQPEAVQGRRPPAHIESISSTTNPFVKHYLKLRQISKYRSPKPLLSRSSPQAIEVVGFPERSSDDGSLCCVELPPKELWPGFSRLSSSAHALEVFRLLEFCVMHSACLLLHGWKSKTDTAVGTIPICKSVPVRLTYSLRLWFRGYHELSEIDVVVVPNARVCGNPHGLIRKYGLMCCRQCFHSNAKAIGFIKVLTSISITLSCFTCFPT
ncbi:40S ribosomal protein S29 [Nymphaea thermarum]|nr:40S ribosomal protein S29 [Nymphaea thermarum]